MNTLENKNILITGATRGIGNKLATHFASQGANIVLLASNEESLNKPMMDWCQLTQKVSILLFVI